MGVFKGQGPGSRANNEVWVDRRPLLKIQYWDSDAMTLIMWNMQSFSIHKWYKICKYMYKFMFPQKNSSRQG